MTISARNKRHLTWIVPLFLLFTVISIGSANTDLPQMGEPVDQDLSPAEESRVGKQFYRAAKAQLPLIQDFESREYLQQLGDRLLSGVNDLVPRNFTFFLIDDDNINAFAIPGGYIGINTGLIHAFQTEGQLAAVIAHEIAHITQRHHARSYSAQGNNGLATAATILAAILIGRESPQAGQAALATGLAISTQNQINYTRANEYEADRIGIDILSRSGFSATSMAESFALLQKNNSLNTSSNQIEYLRTHPLGNNRVAEAKNRAAVIGNKGQKNSLSFQLFKMRLSVLTTSNKVRLRQALIAEEIKYEDNTALYGISLIDSKTNKFEKAKPRIEQLVSKNSNNLFISLIDAQLQYTSGNLKNAMSSFEEIMDLYPTRYSPVNHYAELLIGTTNYRDAYAIVSMYTRRNTVIEPEAYKLLASIMKKLGDDTASHEYLANFYEQNGQHAESIQQLEYALTTAETDSHAELRISAKLKQKQKLKQKKNQ